MFLCLCPSLLVSPEGSSNCFYLYLQHMAQCQHRVGLQHEMMEWMIERVAVQ